MSLLDFYIKKNSNRTWFERYSSTGKNKRGKVFAYTNTNFRTQKTFIDQFNKFESIEGVDRTNWAQAKYKQALDKHRVVNMIDSKLFKREKKDEKEKDFLYSKTEKGKAYKTFIKEIDNFSEETRWFLNYIFLLNGKYNKTPNHIYEKVIFLTSYFEKINLNSDLLLKLIKSAISSKNLEEIMGKDFFYIISFYTDLEFLEIYLNAPKGEKEELIQYIQNNLNSKKFICVISKKYKGGGNYNFSQVIDESKVFYETLQLIKQKGLGVDRVIKANLLDNYEINSFLEKHPNISSIIQNIFTEFYDVDIEVETMKEMSFVLEKEPEPYIDDTSIEGKKKAKQIFASKKNSARDMGKYKCSLEKLNQCKYFTSKITKKNYIEVHHLIPQEFRNEFNNSIEVYANYTTLCPHCHELLHKGVDRERKPCLNFLYEDRKDRLTLLNLNVEIKELYSFYKIDK